MRSLHGALWWTWCPYKGTKRTEVSLSLHCVRKARRELAPGPDLVGIPIADFLASRTIRKKNVCCLSHPVCGGVVTTTPALTSSRSINGRRHVLGGREGPRHPCFWKPPSLWVLYPTRELHPSLIPRGWRIPAPMAEWNWERWYIYIIFQQCRTL